MTGQFTELPVDMLFQIVGMLNARAKTALSQTSVCMWHLITVVSINIGDPLDFDDYDSMTESGGEPDECVTPPPRDDPSDKPACRIFNDHSTGMHDVLYKSAFVLEMEKKGRCKWRVR